MAREAIFSRDTRLWHPDEPGGWRVFPAGEQDPGPAWSEVEGGGGRPEDRDAATREALKAALARAEKAEHALAQRQADIDRLAQQRDDANAKVAGLERRAGEAEKALSEAKADKARYAEERDRAVQNEAALRREVEPLRARIRELEADLISVGADTAEGREAIKAFDHDGDGRPGGRRKKEAVQ